jgi:hypothetical protein
MGMLILLKLLCLFAATGGLDDMEKKRRKQNGQAEGGPSIRKTAYMAQRENEETEEDKGTNLSPLE